MRAITLSSTVILAASLAAASQASAQSIYNLNGSLANQTATSTLVASGGSLNASGGYDFGKNQGLSVSALFNQSAFSSGAYSIFIRASLPDVQNTTSTYGYTKVVDFKNRASDDGLYIVGGSTGGAGLDFIAGGTENYSDIYTDVLQNNQFAVITLTRSTTGVMNFYVNGTWISDMGFTDAAGAAKFTGTNGIAKFFIDDTTVGSDDANSGSVNYISIYNTEIARSSIAGYVAEIPVDVTATPEPASMVLMATGLIGIVGAARRRKTNN